MWRNRRLLISILAGVVGCVTLILIVLGKPAETHRTPPPIRAAIAQAKQRWQSAGISNYTLTLDVKGAWVGIQTITLTVRGDQVVSVSCSRDRQSIACDRSQIAPETYTVAGLFHILEGECVGVTFDPTHAYPQEISRNCDLIFDDELFIHVQALSPERS